MMVLRNLQDTHRLVVVLKAIRDTKDTQQTPVDLASQLLLFLGCPGLVSLVVREHSETFIVVQRVDSDGLLQFLELRRVRVFSASAMLIVKLLLFE
jgi:hypothetical protein